MSKKSILHIFMAAAAAFICAACSPSVYVLSLESRAPSESGIDLDGKSLAVVYLESEDGSDALFNNRVSDAFAYAIEQDLFNGEEAVKVYNLKKEPGGKYMSKDTLSQYVMLLNADVVMLLDTPSVSESSNRRIPVNSRLYIYDSMAEDDVTTLNGHASVTSLADSTKALSIGTSLASPLKSRWVEENFSVLFYGYDSPWFKALSLADDMKWAEAIDIWLDLAKSTNAAKSSCARYNIALGCYILEQYDLALEWLDSSDKTYPLSINKSFRDKIKAKMKK